MAYERNTTEGISSWLQAETCSWNSASIAKGLTEDVMTTISDHYHGFDSRIKSILLMSIMYMRKGDLLLLRDGLLKIIQVALQDNDGFVKTMAHVLKDYPTTQTLDLTVDTWSFDFQDLLSQIGSSIKNNRINFHPLYDLLLQPTARITPPFVSDTYHDHKATHTTHFTLTLEEKDHIVSDNERHSRFRDLVEEEKKATMHTVQKRQASVDLQHHAKRLATSPTSTTRPTLPVRPNPLYTKRPAQPAAGGLFINKRPSNPRPALSRPMPPSSAAAEKPGFQKLHRVQMLDFSAVTEAQQNQDTAVKEAHDKLKALQDAKKQEALDKKLHAAAERKEKADKARQEKAAKAEQRAKEKAAKSAAEAKAAEEAAARKNEREEEEKEVKVEEDEVKLEGVEGKLTTF